MPTAPQKNTLRLSSRIALSIALALAATPAFAVNKDMIQLQTQVADLQTAVAHLQQSNDERMGVLRDLVQQTADSVNKMSVSVVTLEQQMHTQQEASSAKLDQVSGQVQSLNDSLDEVKARLNSLEKALQSVQNQQQSINAALQNLAPPTGSAPPTATAPPNVDQQPTESAPSTDKPSAGIQFPANQGPYANGPGGPASAAGPAATPPLPDLYNAALKDWMAAKYTLATTEFGQVIRAYSSDPLAGNAYFYIGEIDYRAGKYPAAVKDYDHVIDQYPGNPKIPASHLHKGMALLAIKDHDAAVAEFRTLIQRFPNTNEAAQARTKLNGMGVRPTPAHND